MLVSQEMKQLLYVMLRENKCLWDTKGLVNELPLAANAISHTHRLSRQQP